MSKLMEDDGLSDRSLNGTSQSELLLFQMIGPISLLLRNIAVPWVFVGLRFGTSNCFWLKFTLDFVLIVLPIVLSLTLLADQMLTMLLLQIVALLSLIIFSLCEYCLIAREKPHLRQILSQVLDEQHSPTIFVTYMRSIALIATGISILAVDFNVFPRRFAKTYTFGRSIMDLGTATFVYCYGVVDVFKNYPSRTRNVRSSQRHSLYRSSTVLLFVFGLTRTVVLTLFNYPQPVTEYGVHWNFFITLACLRAIIFLLGSRFHLLIGLVIIGVYQYLLTEKHFQDWLLSESTRRDDLISMNREGIFSLFGYLSLYYFASAIAKYLSTTGIRLKSWYYRSIQLLMIAGVLFIWQNVAEYFFGPPSRRIANLSYVLEMLVFHTLYMTGFLLVQLASIFGWAAQMPQFSIDENPFERLKPCLLDSINQKAIYYFILSNLLTGFVNIGISTWHVSNSYHSTAIIVIYMLIICATAHCYARYRSSSH